MRIQATTKTPLAGIVISSDDNKLSYLIKRNEIKVVEDILKNSKSFRHAQAYGYITILTDEVNTIYATKAELDVVKKQLYYAISSFSGNGGTGEDGASGYSGKSGYGISGYSGLTLDSGYSGLSGFSSNIAGTSGYSGLGFSGYSGLGYSGISGFSSQSGISGFSSNSGISGFSSQSGVSGYSAYSGDSGYSGYSGLGESGYSGLSGFSSQSGISGFSSQSGISGFSSQSGISGYSSQSGYSAYSGNSGISGYSAYSGNSGISGFSSQSGISGYSAFSGISGFSSQSGYSAYSGNSGISGYSAYSGNSGISGYSAYSGNSGISGFSSQSGFSGYSAFSGISGFSSQSGISGYSAFSGISGFSSQSGFSGYSAFSGISGFSSQSGFSGNSGISGFSSQSGISGYSAFSGISGYSGNSGFSGYSSTVAGTSGYSGFSSQSGISGFSSQSGISGFSGYSSTVAGTSGYSGAGTTLAVDMNRYGFLNRTETSISFDGIDTFTLADKGSGWTYYRTGTRCTISGNKTKVLATPMVDNTLYYIYIDATNGTLSVSSPTGWNLNDTKVPVATVYWNSTLTPKYIMADERHTCQIDRAFHREHHYTDGTELERPGNIYGLTPGSDTNSDKTFGIGSTSTTSIYDEDLHIEMSALPDPDGATPVYYNLYRTSATTYAWAISDMPFKYSGASAPYGYIEYDNGSGVSTQAGSQRFVNTYVLVSNIVSNSEADPEISTSAQRYLIVQGRNQFTSASSAYGESFGSFNLIGFPLNEGLAIYQITWATTNRPDTVKGRCRYVSTQRVTSNIVSSSTTVTAEHNTLAGLQGGTTGEYYHLTAQQYTELPPAVSGQSGYVLTNDGSYTSWATATSLQGTSGYSGKSGISGYSAYSGISGYSAYSGISGYSAYSGISGYSAYSGISGYSAYSGNSGISGYSAFSGISGFSSQSGISGYSAYSGISGYSAFSGISGYSSQSGFSGYSSTVAGISGYSAYSGISGFSSQSGISGYSAFSGISGYSAYSGISGYSAFSGISGFSSQSGISGYSAYSGISGYSGFSGASSTTPGASGYSGASSTLLGVSGYSGYATSGISGKSGISGYSAYSGISGYSGFSSQSGISGYSADSGISGYSANSGISGYSSTALGFSGISGYSGGGGPGGAVGYTETTAFNAVPTTSTITTTSDLTATIKTGYPLKYVISGVSYYGIVTAINATTITVGGAPLTGLPSNLYYGTPNLAQYVHIFIGGRYSQVASNTLIADFQKAFVKWDLSTAYLVRFSVRSATSDTGANEPRINVFVNGAAVSTSNTNAGLTIVDAAWATTIVDINTSNYDIQFSEAVELTVDANGSNKDAENLSVQLTFVFEK